VTDAALRELFRVSDTWTDQQLDAIIKIHREIAMEHLIQTYEQVLHLAETTGIKNVRNAYERAKMERQLKINTP
jgi:biotin-(acetyl-CoA carboxylase) ligase